MTLNAPTSNNAIVALLLLLPACAASVKGGPIEISQSVVIDDLPSNAKSLEIWLPIAQSAPHQQVALQMNADGGSFDNDAGFGNRFWHVVLPAKTVELTLTYNVTLRGVDAPHPTASEDLAEFEQRGLWAFLQPTRAVPVGVNLSSLGPAALGAPHERAKAALKVSGQLDGTGCERHERFASLARTAGVPVRLDTGWLLRDDVPQAHCWAQYYLHGTGWVLADAQLGLHGARGGDRLRVSTGRDLRLKGEPDHSHHGQNIPDGRPPTVETFLQPYVEIDGVPWSAGVQTTMSVKR